MKKLKITPTYLSVADPALLASAVSLRIFAEKKTAYPGFNLWFEQGPIKAYIRYSQVYSPLPDDERANPVWAICLSNVEVHPDVQRRGAFTKLLEELENKAHIHDCRFYVENAISEAVVHTCEKRGYKKFAPAGSTMPIYSYWFDGIAQMRLVPPDLFADQEAEQAFREGEGKP